MTCFMVMTMGIIMGGVHNGIERWSTRLMPALVVTLVALALYVFTLDGAVEGLKVYLLPDFSKVLSGDLILAALGSAFFSLSLGVGTMLIYGSYLSDDEYLPSIGAQVALIDIGLAVLAGFLILPSMYVAAERGVEIFDASGALLSEDTLIFSVLPALFTSLGSIGVIVANRFFWPHEYGRPHLVYFYARSTCCISGRTFPVESAESRDDCRHDNWADQRSSYL